jgi:hypothetical protein
MNSREIHVCINAYLFFCILHLCIYAFDEFLGLKTKHKIDGTLIVSPSIALPATRPSIRSPAAGSQKGRWETISGVSKDRWQIISGVCSGRCSKKA